MVSVVRLSGAAAKKLCAFGWGAPRAVVSLYLAFRAAQSQAGPDSATAAALVEKRKGHVVRDAATPIPTGGNDGRDAFAS